MAFILLYVFFSTGIMSSAAVDRQSSQKHMARFVQIKAITTTFLLSTKFPVRVELTMAAPSKFKAAPSKFMIFHAPQIVCFQTSTVQHFNLTINTFYFMLPLLYPHAAMTPGSPGSAFLVILNLHLP